MSQAISVSRRRHPVRRRAVLASRRARLFRMPDTSHPHPGRHQGDNPRDAHDAARRGADHAVLVDQAPADHAVRDFHRPPVEPVPRPRPHRAESRSARIPTISPKTEKTSHDDASCSHGPAARRRHDRIGGGGPVHHPTRHRGARGGSGVPVRLGPVPPARCARRGDDRGGDRLGPDNLPVPVRARTHPSRRASNEPSPATPSSSSCSPFSGSPSGHY